MKKYKVTLGLLLLGILLVLVVVALVKKSKQKGDDFRIGIFADDGIAMVSISKSRNMINFLKINKESKVWLPQGMGWYRSEVVKKILIQENKKDLYNDILFYNFGFAADKIVSLKKIDDWRSKFWWRLKIGNLINKPETLSGDSDVEVDWLNEVMLRDFSETKVFDEDLKISVINISQENGLATFITNNLERLGFSVVSIITGDKEEEMDSCTILYGDGVENSYSLSLLNSLFDCKKFFDLSLNSDEVEIYLNDKFASMIKYSSYYKK
jgi:hypothetical protein